MIQRQAETDHRIDTCMVFRMFPACLAFSGLGTSTPDSRHPGHPGGLQ